MTVTSQGQTLPASEFCYKTKVTLEESAKMQQAAGVTCTEQSYKKDGDAWTGHSVCSIDIAGKKTTTTTDSKVTGDFNTKYTMDISSKMDPAPMPGMEEQKMSIVAERLGDC